MKKLNKNQTLNIGKVILPYGVAFLISFVAGIILFAVKKISPFGEQSLLCMDLWGQYFPMYVQQANADSLADLFYSWNGALGYNNWAQSAYYCNSIFLVILKLVPLSKMVTVLDWLCLVKIGLSAVSCLGFLKYKLNEKSPILIAGAVSYSLCTYMLAFISQCMWTDSLIYVPIVLIGIEKLVHQQKPLLYTLMLALTIISNFYIGFAVCIFSVLYFICVNFQQLHFEKNLENTENSENTENPKKKFNFKLKGGKNFGIGIFDFALFSILAGMISAVVILPIGFAISNTLASEMNAPTELKWYSNITAYLQLMLPNQSLSLGYSGANIATSILVPVLIPLYFCNKKVRILEKITNGFVLAFLLASLDCNILDYIWHGFHFPNQLPARWTFLLSLFMVMLACTGIARFKGLTPIRTLIGSLLGIAIIIITCKGLGEQSSVSLDLKYIIIIAVSEILILTASVLIYFENKFSEKNISLIKRISICCIAVVSLLQIYDSCTNFKNVAQLETGGLSTSNITNYSKLIVKADNYGSKWKNSDDDFYRIEANSGFTFNPSMIGDYQGIGYYSSTMQGSVFELMQYLGNRVYAANVSTVYNLTSPVQNGIFGVKYFLDNNKNLGNVLPEANLIEENEDCNIWENPTALPVAFAVSDDLMDWNVTDEIRGIQNQNDLLNKMCGRDVNAFKQMSCTKFSYANANLQENSNWNQNFFYTVDSQSPVTFHYVYTCESDAPIYLEHNFRAGTIAVTWDGGNRDVSVGSEKFCYLGEFSAGSTITIDVTIENIYVGCCGLNLYSFDSEAWSSAYEQLSSQAITVDEFKTTSIKGRITMNEDGLVFTSIPQDGGWKVICDGKEINTLTFGDTLVGFKISEGTHIIEFKYTVPGFNIGLIASIFGLLFTIWICCPKLRSKLSLKKKAQNITD